MHSPTHVILRHRRITRCRLGCRSTLGDQLTSEPEGALLGDSLPQLGRNQAATETVQNLGGPYAAGRNGQCAQRSGAPTSCTCRVPLAPTTSSTIRHCIPPPARIPDPGHSTPQVLDGLVPTPLLGLAR
jgi:hypothetical protein